MAEAEAQVTEQVTEVQQTETPEESLFASDTAETGTETETKDAGSEELIFGKYKSMEDAEKGYKSLVKKMAEGKESSPEPTDETPYGYNFQEAFEKNGIKAIEYTDQDGNEIPEAKEKYDQFFNSIREAGFSQKQFEVMTEVGSQWLKDQMASFASEYGPEVDLKAEQAKLEKEFGDDYAGTTQAISKWAVANLPADVFKKPLYRTAEGMKLLNKLRSMESENLKPVEGNISGLDPVELDQQIDELMRSPEYKRLGKGKTAVEKKVEDLIKKRSQIK